MFVVNQNAAFADSFFCAIFGQKYLTIPWMLTSQTGVAGGRRAGFLFIGTNMGRRRHHGKLQQV